MKKLVRIVLATILCAFSTSVFAQQKTIKGTVTDENGKALQGATVSLKGSKAQLSTNDQGSFSITTSGGVQTLVFTYSGKQSKEVTVEALDNNIEVSLLSNTLSMDDVVVVAYGRQKKATLTGSVSTVTGKELVSTSVSNVSNMLIGNAPGLSGLQTSGEPGRNGASIFIRGRSTFNGSTDPLFVIDGVEQATEQGYTQFNSMDANEIDNISILKDASATAVYGIRGANGVVIITTKRGKMGKPSLSMAINSGITRATDLIHNTNSYDYAVMRNEAIRVEQSAFGSSGFNAYLFDDKDLWKLKNNRDYSPEEVAAMNLSDAQKAQLNASPALYYGSRDLFAEQFGGKGPQKQLNLNVSGGTSRVKYYTSLGYFDQGSILTNTKYEGANTSSTFHRYNFRSNFDIDVVKNLTISVNLAGQFGETSGPGIGAGPNDLSGRYKIIMQYIFDSNPLTAPGLVEGKMINSYQGVAGSANNPLGIKLGSQKGAQNPIRNLLVSGNETIYNTLLTATLVARYNLGYLVKGLAIRGTANYDDNYTKGVTYAPSLPDYSVRRNPANPNGFQFFGGGIGASTFNTNPGHDGAWRKMYFDAGIDYNRSFGGHNVTALALGKAQRYSLPGGTEYTPSGLMGLVGQVKYNYKERYLADVNVGYNGTEQFIEGERFGLFPAYSAGWVISGEPLFPKNNWVTFLKVRASYGEVGSDQINGGRRYLYLPSTFNTGQAGFYWGASNGSVVNPFYSGATEGTIGNPAVTWEKTLNKNLGIEANFLKNRLTFSADIYKYKRKDIITTLSQIIPYAYGVASGSIPPVNVGQTTNHGYEMVLGWTERYRDFGYYVTANVNYNRNKIEYQAEAQKAYPWMMTTGYAIGQYKGLLTDGFYNTQENLVNAPYNTYNANKVALGDVRYKDINGDGQISDKDVVPIGFSNLPQYSFSVKAGFNYKGFDVSSLLIGSAEGSFNLMNYQAFNAPFFQNAGNLVQWQFDGRWTADKVKTGELILYPRATINAGAGSNANFLNSDLWLISSNFMRLKNVEIGYTVPALGFLRRASISAVRIYANGNNLVTWNSKLLEKGIDPEARDTGGYLYPITRVFVVGANIRF